VDEEASGRRVPPADGQGNRLEAIAREQVPVELAVVLATDA
jgi:hypothetical protein